jgi:hypothetical protein
MFRSLIECAGYCLAISQCSAFFWNKTTFICQPVVARNLAGDLTSQAVDGFIDKTLKPGFDEIIVLKKRKFSKSFLKVLFKNSTLLFLLVDASWGLWSEWDNCSLLCNSGNMTRTRICPNPVNGGLRCPSTDSAIDSKVCNTNACPRKKLFSSSTFLKGCN